jgi:putative nucleotidyltransferase with HDIG domain
MFTGIMSITAALVSAVVILKLMAITRQNRQQLHRLHDIDRSILSGLSHKGVMHAIMDKLTSVLKPDAAAILVIDKQHNLKTAISDNLSKKFNDFVGKMTNGFFSSVIENRKPLNITRISDDEDESFLEAIRDEGFISSLSAPIIVKGGMPAGILTLYSRKPRAYTERELTLIDSINSRIGVALDHAKLIERIQEINIESVRALVEAIELRDPYTIGHSIQVANLATRIAQELELSEREKNLIEFAGLLHDVGKIIVPEAILQKSSVLTDEEWQIIKRHVVHSAKIIEPIRNLRSVQNWILHHHEQWDGSGYPDGISAEKIPLQSRILAVCDAYSAMTGDRPYRKALSDEDARREIVNVAGKQLDPKIVSLFLSLDLEINEKGETHKEGEKHVDIEAKA